jgi:hypothetical protein
MQQTPVSKTDISVTPGTVKESAEIKGLDYILKSNKTL